MRIVLSFCIIKVFVKSVVGLLRSGKNMIIKNLKEKSISMLKLVPVFSCAILAVSIFSACSTVHHSRMSLTSPASHYSENNQLRNNENGRLKSLSSTLLHIENRESQNRGTTEKYQVAPLLPHYTRDDNGQISQGPSFSQQLLLELENGEQKILIVESITF